MFSTRCTVIVLILVLQIWNVWSTPAKRLTSKREHNGECKDDRADCADIPVKGEELKKYCEQWKDDPAIKGCRKTCGWCKAPYPPNRCEDQRDDCNWLVDNLGAGLDKYCQQYKDSPAVKMCAKTCRFCKKPPSPTIPPTKQPRPPLPETPPPKPKTNPPRPQTPPPRPHTPPPRPQTQPPKPQPTNKPPGGKMTGFEKECLVAHNKLRALHQSPALIWSNELTEDAQFWANKLANDNSFQHYPKLKELNQGENLAWFSPANRMCDGPSDKHCAHCGEFVQDWYNEIEDYSFSKGAGKDPWSVVLHFTQVVWKGSTELGMATAQAHNRVVAVARYRKAGNQGSNEDFKKNVLVGAEP